jgi:hypothetical protein
VGRAVGLIALALARRLPGGGVGRRSGGGCAGAPSPTCCESRPAAEGLLRGGRQRRAARRDDVPRPTRRSSRRSPGRDPLLPARWGTDVAGVVIDDDVDWEELRELVTESYCRRAPQAGQAGGPATGLAGSLTQSLHEPA